MMALCKSVHTLLGFPEADELSWGSPHQCRNMAPPGDEVFRLLAAVTPMPLEEKVDAGARGLHECAYGGDRGLELCTESLGSESCDGGMAAEEVAQWEMSAASAAADEGKDKKSRRGARSGWRRTKEGGFPPPLRWLTAGSGRRSGFMRAERRDGRLILTEVRVDRPEFFRARREDGRLRLHLIESEGADAAEAEGGATATQEEEGQVEARGERRNGEGLRRCQEAAARGSRGVPLWWNHRFVMTS